MFANTFSTFVLSNGLTVVHALRPQSSNVSISVMVLAGSIYETKDEVGVAHFMEHLVSDGTEKYPTTEAVSLRIDGRGGTRSAITNKETIEYTVRVLAEDAEIDFDYLSQIIIHPLLRDVDIENQKKIITQEINRLKANPEQVIQRHVYTVLFPSSRLASFVTGDVADVKRISRAESTSYHQRTHCAKNMIISVCGGITVGQVREFTEKYFGELTSGQKISRIVIPDTKIGQPLSIQIPKIDQAFLALGYRGFDASTPAHYAANILSILLSRGKSSRLFREVREKRALAYAVFCSHFASRNFGTFMIQTGLSQENIAQCIEVIKAELAKTVSIEVTDDELKKILAQIRANYAFSFESTLSEASFYARSWCNLGKNETMEQQLTDYEAVIHNPGFISETAARMFAGEPAIVTIEDSAT